MLFAVLLLAAAVAVGTYEGLVRARAATTIVTAAAFLGISNLIASWPWFVADQPHTWARTYLSALVFTGWVSLLIHVVPFWLAWYFAKQFQITRSRHAA